MVENEGKPEEGKFDFTRAGETRAYISLDQARVLAMRTARESPGAYGRRFADDPMAFEVVEAEETEDHYIVTLSLRPQGQFTGTSGREQFFIEKEGAVAHRQVLSPPIRAGERRFAVIAAAIGLVVVAIGAVVGVLFAVGGNGAGGDGIPVAAPVPSTAPFSPVTPAPLAALVPTNTPTATPTPPATVLARGPTASPATNPIPTKTPTPRPTNTPTPTPITLSPNVKPAALFGPTDGVLIHDPDANQIIAESSNVNLANVVTEARFFNPYATSVGTWSSGFLLRNSGRNEFHGVVIRSNGTWEHWARTGPDDSRGKLLQRRKINGIDTTAGGSNHLLVMTFNNVGWLFVNGGLAGELDLSNWNKPGNVKAVAGFFTGDELSGKFTVFEDLSVWSITDRFASTDGVLIHDPGDGTMEQQRSGVNLTDLVVEAQLFNPYPASEGPWSHGFIFRNSGTNEFHGVVIRSN